MRPIVLAAAVLILAACQPAADGAAAGAAPETSAETPAATLRIGDGWVRASLGRNPHTGGYLPVANPGPEADRLTGAACACAARVELHTVSTDGGVMRMNAVEAMEVPAGGTLTLAPGGDHLMFLDLVAPLADGQSVEVTLTFERAGEMTVQLPVHAAAPDHADAHDAHAGH